MMLPTPPKQFTNSLGKLQAISVKAPRRMLDVGVMLSEPEGNSTQKDIRLVFTTICGYNLPMVG